MNLPGRSLGTRKEMDRMPTSRLSLAALALTLMPAPIPARAGGAEPGSFEVRYDAAVCPGPISGRVYVMLGPAAGREPRIGPDWFAPQPFFAADVEDWKPDEATGVGALGFPGPIADLKPGRYAAQAVVRLNPDTHA